jgi:hypothetical protein
MCISSKPCQVTAGFSTTKGGVEQEHQKIEGLDGKRSAIARHPIFKASSL